LGLFKSSEHKNPGTGGAMYFYNIRNQSIPAWYELGTIEESGIFSLRIDIRQDAWKYFLNVIHRRSDIHGHIGSEAEKENPIHPLNQHFPGNDGILLPLPKRRENWISWKCELPRYDKGWKKYYSIAELLNQLFTVLNIMETEIKDYYLPQMLAVINLSSDKEPRAFYSNQYLGVMLSLDLCRWIKGLGPCNQSRISAAMHQAALRIFDKAYREDYRTEIFAPGNIHFSVPGDACGLDTIRRGTTDVQEMHGHNIDTPMQQLILFSGVCALYDSAKIDYWLNRHREKISLALQLGGLKVIYQMFNDTTLLVAPNDRVICLVDGKVDLAEIQKKFG